MSYSRHKIGDVAQAKGGKRLPKGTDFSIGPTSHPYIRARDIGEGVITFDDPVYVTETTYEKIRRYTVNEGDVCITIVGANVGDVGEVPNGLHGANLTENAAKLVVDLEMADPRFLKYVLLTDDAQAQMKQFASGSAQPKLALYKIEEVEVPLPTLCQQRQIAGILSAYDDLIENNTRRIKILEEMAQSLYREWFVHFRYPGHEHVPLVESPAGLIPEGWETLSFKDLLESFMGGDWGKDLPDDLHTRRVTVLRGTDIGDLAKGASVRSPIRYIKESSFAKRRLRLGDVVVENSVNASSRSVGTSLLITDGVLRRLGNEAIAASFCKVFRPIKPDISPLMNLRMKHLRAIAKMPFYQNVAANGIANFQAQRFVESEYLTLPTRSGEPAVKLTCLAALSESTFADQISLLRQHRDLLLSKLLSNGSVGQLNPERR